MGVLGDPFKSEWGYSMLWLIVLYCIGALAKRIKLFEKQKSIVLIILWTICMLVTWFTHSWLGIGRLVNYISPTILMSGMIMVILFSRINLKGTIISKISPLAFGIYLFQLNQVIWNNYINNAFAFVASGNLAIGVLLVFAFAALIFISGLFVEFIRAKIAALIRIPSLSKQIVKGLNFIIQKLFIFLN